MKPLVLYGAGGLGRETAALVESINAEEPCWDLRGFVDDDASLQGKTVQQRPVLGNGQWLADQHEWAYVLAIGSARVRRKIGQRLEAADLEAGTLVHPGVPLHDSLSIGPGSILCRGSTPTVSVEMGRHVFINLHCTIGHDTVIRDYAVLHPGVHLSGATVIGEAAELGTGAVVLPGVTIGEGCIVGAGAVVTEDLPPHVTAVGVPAQPLP